MFITPVVFYTQYTTTKLYAIVFLYSYLPMCWSFMHKIHSTEFRSFIHKYLSREFRIFNLNQIIFYKLVYISTGPLLYTLVYISTGPLTHIHRNSYIVSTNWYIFPRVRCSINWYIFPQVRCSVYLFIFVYSYRSVYSFTESFVLCTNTPVEDCTYTSVESFTFIFVYSYQSVVFCTEVYQKEYAHTPFGIYFHRPVFFIHR